MKKTFKKFLRKIPLIKTKIINNENLIKNNESLLNKNILLENLNNKLSNETNLLKQKYFELNQNRYSLIIENIKRKLANNEKIRFCFFVMLDSAFAGEPLYKKIIQDDIFKPYIVIIPDTSRGFDYMIKSYLQTYKSLHSKYKNVYNGYNIKKNTYIDYSKKMDIVYIPIPYSGMSHHYFEIDYLLNKNILPIHISYSFQVTKFSREVYSSDFYNYMWKIFVPTNSHLKEINKYSKINGKNTAVTGYCKMDELQNYNKMKKNKKIIIVAPHHTVSPWKFLQISNFLKYSDFFLKLPKLYPQINFIFRPHPLLIVQLKKPEVWGEEKTNRYFKTMESYSNVTYSRGGEYFDIFLNSDGIIHDCGSFLAEYLFTEKPACYILKNKKSIKKWFLPIGQKCLDYCYHAYSEKNIINYIENIILDNKDTLKKERVNFVNSELKINYPNVSQIIIDHIKKEFIN